MKTLGLGSVASKKPSSSLAPFPEWADLQRPRNWSPPLPLHERHCWGNEAASASSTLPAVCVSHPQPFREHNVHSPNGGFAGGTTDSILTARSTSQHSVRSRWGVLRLKWRELILEAARPIMPHGEDVVSMKLGSHLGARSQHSCDV